MRGALHPQTSIRVEGRPAVGSESASTKRHATSRANTPMWAWWSRSRGSSARPPGELPHAVPCTQVLVPTPLGSTLVGRGPHTWPMCGGWPTKTWHHRVECHSSVASPVRAWAKGFTCQIGGPWRTRIPTPPGGQSEMPLPRPLLTDGSNGCRVKGQGQAPTFLPEARLLASPIGGGGG